MRQICANALHLHSWLVRTGRFRTSWQTTSWSGPNTSPAMPYAGLRTTLTFRLFCPPQKNRSPPSDSSPEIVIPRGMPTLSSTCPVRGSTRRKSLSSYSSVACQSSPATHVTPRHEAVGFDRTKNRPCLGINLMNFAIPILAHPESPFGPREPGVAAPAWRGDCGEHLASVRIDLLDAVLSDLI